MGQGCWEEINYVANPGNGGQNYGWRQMEGNHCYQFFGSCNPPAQTCASSPACNDPSLTDPVHEYGHSGASPTPCSITGGYVYRGCRMSGFQGIYFYGDYCNGFIKSFEISGGLPTDHLDWTLQLDPGNSLDFGLTSFGVDAQGEILYADRNSAVYKIVPPLPDLEVSARPAAFFLLDKVGDWTWEDLAFSTGHPVTFYRVYRGTPNGAFTCVHKTAVPRWAAGGDPATPAPDALFAYVVTAINAAGAETQKGHPGTFDASGCP